MCLHSPSVKIEPNPSGSGNTGLWRITRCLSTHLVPVSLDLDAAKASSVFEYRLTLQVAQLYLGIASSEQMRLLYHLQSVVNQLGNRLLWFSFPAQSIICL